MPFYLVDENGNQFEINPQYIPAIQQMMGISEQQQQQPLPPGYVQQNVQGGYYPGSLPTVSYSYLPQTGGGMVYAGGRPDVIPESFNPPAPMPVRVMGQGTYYDGFNRPVSPPVRVMGQGTYSDGFSRSAPAPVYNYPVQQQRFVPSQQQLDATSRMGIRYQDGVFTNQPESDAMSRMGVRNNNGVFTNRTTPTPMPTTEQPETPVPQTRQTPAPTPVQQTRQTPAPTPVQRANRTSAADLSEDEIWEDYVQRRRTEREAANADRTRANSTRTTARDALQRSDAYNVDSYIPSQYDYNLLGGTTEISNGLRNSSLTYDEFIQRWGAMPREEKQRIIYSIIARKVDRAIQGGMRM